jgi:hypothetical protein
VDNSTQFNKDSFGLLHQRWRKQDAKIAIVYYFVFLSEHKAKLTTDEFVQLSGTEPWGISFPQLLTLCLETTQGYMYDLELYLGLYHK